MKFVTANSCRTQLERLTQLLMSAFPGSTVYQHTELFLVPHVVLNNKVDAVLLAADMDKMDSLDLMQKLRRQKMDLPVFILSENNGLCDRAIADGATGYFVLPDSEQQLLDAIREMASRKKVS